MDLKSFTNSLLGKKRLTTIVAQFDKINNQLNELLEQNKADVKKQQEMIAELERQRQALVKESNRAEQIASKIREFTSV